MQGMRFANGDRMPVLGLGTWKAEPGEVGAALRTALKIGYRHIDCAAIYGNEKEIGQALKAAMQSGEVTRDQLWVTSKLWNNAHGRGQAAAALKKTLHDLQLDYLDLYLIHWPVAIRPEITFPTAGEHFLSLDEVPLHETWAGMLACVDQGLARHVGVSNFAIHHLEAISRGTHLRPEVNQVELHPYLQQKELLGYCIQQGIHLIAYAPLGSGDRPDILKRTQEKSLLKNDVVGQIARTHGCTPAQVLLAWAMARGAAVIPKSVNPARLIENFEAQQIVLGSAEMQQLADLDAGLRYVHGEFWTIDGSPYSLKALWGDETGTG